MNKQVISPRFITLSLLIVGAAFTRAFPLLVSGAWNFTAVGALAIFAGSQFRDNRLAFAVPLLAMSVADFFIGDGFNILVYIGLTSMVVCGIFIRNKANLTNLALASVSSALVFYLITNFAYFYPQSLYTHDMTGVITSYIMALPFLRNMLVGDAFYGLLLFGGFSLLRQRYPVLSIQ